MALYKNCRKQLIITFLGLCLASSALGVSNGLKPILQAFDGQEFEKTQTYVDQLIQDRKYQQESSVWYYRGVIYEQLMRKDIISDSAALYLEEALKSYQKAIAVSEEKTQFHSFSRINIQGLWAYYLNRGTQYYKIDAFEEALEQFEICQNIQRDVPITLLYIAITAHQAERYELALEYYNKYIKSGMSHPVATRALAQLTATHLNELQKAYMIVHEGLQQYPYDINLLEEYYQLLVRTSQLEARKAELQDQITKSSNNPRIYYQLAYLSFRENKYKKASLYYSKALEVMPWQLEIILELGKVHYNQGCEILKVIGDMPKEAFQENGKKLIEKTNAHLEKSLHYFELANKISPKNLHILKPLYTLYARLNKPQKATQLAAKIRRIKGGVQLLEGMEI